MEESGGKLLPRSSAAGAGQQRTGNRRPARAAHTSVKQQCRKLENKNSCLSPTEKIKRTSPPPRPSLLHTQKPNNADVVCRKGKRQLSKQQLAACSPPQPCDARHGRGTHPQPHSPPKKYTTTSLLQVLSCCHIPSPPPHLPTALAGGGGGSHQWGPRGVGNGLPTPAHARTAIP